MLTRDTLRILCGVLLLASLSGCGSDSTQSDSGIPNANIAANQGALLDACSIAVPDPEPEDLSALALVSFEDATKVVAAAYPAVKIVESELENEDGCLVYSFDLDNDLEVLVDAGNAAILSVEDESGDDDDDHDSDDEEEGEH